jgi:hypothetical protein
MGWCEKQENVHFLLGLARNARLQRALGSELHQAQQAFELTHQSSRFFRDFSYRTRKSWSRERRVVGKAEHLAKGPNPRYVVTSLDESDWNAAALYDLYCQRGDMENRIKEQQLELFADRTSAHFLQVNQVRLWWSSVAYTLLAELRRLGLAGTSLAHAQCGTIRLRLLKIGAVLRISHRRLWVSLSSAYPLAPLWRQVFLRLQALPPPWAAV